MPKLEDDLLIVQQKLITAYHYQGHFKLAVFTILSILIVSSPLYLLSVLKRSQISLVLLEIVSLLVTPAILLLILLLRRLGLYHDYQIKHWILQTRSFIFSALEILMSLIEIVIFPLKAFMLSVWLFSSQGANHAYILGDN